MASMPQASSRSRTIPGSTSDEGSMEEASRTHIVLIPSYNPGARVYETVQAARRSWNPVWIVVDASSDGTAEGLLAMGEVDPGLKVIVLPRKGGKGEAGLYGFELSEAAG